METGKVTKRNAKILFAEDNADYRDIISDVLRSCGYDPVCAENGKRAEEISQTESFDLYLVDYDMPVVNGEQFVSRLKMKEPQAVIIMLTAVNESDKIIHLMKLGVFDYLLKPSSAEKVKKTVEKALLFRQTLKEQYERQLSTAKEIQSRVLWNEYKKNSLNGADEVTKEVLENMRRNFLQGSGLGAQICLVNMIDLIKGEKDAEGNYRISAETVDLLISNNIFNQKQLSTLTNTLSVLSSSSFPLQFMRVSEILKKFEAGSFQSVKTVFEKDPHSGIRLEPLKNDAIVNVNEDYLNLALEELLINAAKYASPKSRIHIYSYQKDGFIFLSVKNSVNSEEEGVPEESEKLVIEPFYRLSKTAEDLYIEYDEKYSTGLGLCVVNYIVKKHYGLFWIKNHKDHISSGSGICTIAEIGLPIERAA